MRPFPISEARKNKIDTSRKSKIISDMNKYIKEESEKEQEYYGLHLKFDNVDWQTYKELKTLYEDAGYEIYSDYNDAISMVTFKISW